MPRVGGRVGSAMAGRRPFPVSGAGFGGGRGSRLFILGERINTRAMSWLFPPIAYNRTAAKRLSPAILDDGLTMTG